MRLFSFLSAERIGSRHLIVGFEALLALTTCLLLTRGMLLH